MKICAAVVGVVLAAVGVHDGGPVHARGAACARADARRSIGAAAGAVAGLITGDSSMERKKRALVGAGLGALAGAGVGTYMDRQQARAAQEELERTGVSVTRIGDNITLNMPGNITFATDSADLNAGFFDVLNSVGMVVNEFEQTVIEVAGHTDSTGSDQYNQQLSERRANAVAAYLKTRSVRADRIITVGAGESHPVAIERHGRGASAQSAGRAHARAVDGQIVARKKGGRAARAARPFAFFARRELRPHRTSGRDHLRAQLRDRVRLDLANALRRDVVLRRELVQRRPCRP